MAGLSVGLRARLLCLVLAAVIPAFGLIGYTAITQRHHAALIAKKDAMSLVRLAAREQSHLIVSTRQLLMSVAQLPITKTPGDPRCNRVLADLIRPYPYYTNLAVATRDGRVLCSAVPHKEPVTIADRGYFKRAVDARDFGLGDYQIGRITGIPAINFAYPVVGRRGNVKVVVYAALNLTWLDRLATGVQLPIGSTLSVVDDRGIFLAHHPDPQPWIGKPMREPALLKAMLGHPDEGTAEIAGLDGKTQLFAFAPLYNTPAAKVYVSVGIPRALAFAAANQVFVRNMTLLLLVALLAAAAAWVGSEVFVLRRIRALTTAAQRLARGELSVRTGLPHGNEELGQLAHSFDDMASALEKTNRALKTLSAGNRALVRATDEQELLETMCRIIVEVGDYPFAWVGYAQRDEHKSIRPVAQAGFEGGLEKLAGVLSNLTWTDTERGRGPAAKAIRTGESVVARDLLTDPDFQPWQEQARERGYASAATFPLHVHGQVIGVLSVYSREPEAFDQGELKLLAEAAGDLAFGIAGLRTSLAREQASETIKHMAYYDGPTGLPNHVQFEERLQQLLAATGAPRQPLALLLVDLDRFREINEALGFNQGDQLLKDVGARIRDAVGERGFVVRMRGDEFAILLPTSDAEHAEETAQLILQALRTPFALRDITLDVSVAIGIALAPQHGRTATTLVRRMDKATRQAKKSGEHYAFYVPEKSEDNTRRLVLARELRHAIEAGELVLHYQPKVDMRAGSVCGAEALVRWKHPQHGMIPPDEFISLAEHTGLIKPLTAWVLEAALRQSSAWRQAGVAVPVAVNLSARNLRETDLAVKMKQLFLAWNTRAEWLELEITESAIMDDPDRALQTLTRLNTLGIALFIDDFGTGYSSLGYLQRLPVGAIKIDKSFVQEMLTDSDSAAIVRSTVTLAHDLGIQVVAEGVESQKMWDRLAELGCDIAQGYFISKPMPADEFQVWFTQSRWSPQIAANAPLRPKTHNMDGRRRR